MQELNLFKRQKTVIYVFLTLAVCLLLSALCYVFFGDADIFVLVTAVLLVLLNSYNLYSFNKSYFRYEAGVVKWRFPRMKSGNVLEVLTVKNVKQETFGITFKNKKGEGVKISTDGLGKKDRALIFSFFSGLEIG